MKTIMKLFSAGITAVIIATTVNSCQQEPVVEQIEETVQEPVEVSHIISVTVGAGFSQTKSTVETDGSGNRTLKFTSGDKLRVLGSIELDLGAGATDCVLSGTLDLVSISVEGTSASFSGNLKLQKVTFVSYDPLTGPVYDYEDVDYDFGENDPLAACDQCSAILVHEGTSLPGDSGYTSRIASTVEELMTTCLTVRGSYDASEKSFSLSVGAPMMVSVYPIFNCTINGGLTASTAFDAYLLSGMSLESANESYLGSITADAEGKVSFACYAQAYSQERYYAFRFKDGDNWKLAELGTKSLTGKVYNVTRTAIEDPAAPIRPTITGTPDGEFHKTDLSVYFQTAADITMSGTSKGYCFRFFDGGSVRLDNITATEPDNHSFLFSYTDLNIELAGDNSISSENYSCVEGYGDVKLSCTGSSATLSVTYKAAGVYGIEAHNFEHEPLEGEPAYPMIISGYSAPELAASGYSVKLTTVDNGNGTWTTTYNVYHTFSIGSSSQAIFAPGNLQYTISTGTWNFMEHQYDILENDSWNIQEDYSNKDVVSLFGWGTWGEGKTPNLTIADNVNYAWSTDITGTINGISSWRTPSSSEWVYLLGPANDTPNPGTNCRTSSTVGGTENARFTLATINTDATSVKGLIIFPDVYTAGTPAGVTWGTINASSSYTTTCTTAGWSALEAAGCVFLPAAGSRYHNSPIGVGTNGNYHSSTANGNNTYCFVFQESSYNPWNNTNRYQGRCVRLVLVI